MVVRELINVIGFRVDHAALRSAESKINNVAGKLQNVGRSLSLFVSTPIIGISIAALRASGAIERMTASFEVFLGSTEKASGFVEQLIDFSARTPLQIENLERGATTLLGYGEAAERLIPTLRMIGDATRGNNEQFQRAVLALGQIRGATILRGQELRQLIEAQVNILPELAKVTGFTVKEIVGETAKLGISYEQVIEALRIATSEGGTYFNLLEKQSKTLFGSLTTLKDTFTLLFKEIGDSIDEVFYLRSNIRRLIDLIKRLTKWLSSLSEAQRTVIVFFAALLAVFGPTLITIGSIIDIFGAFIGIAGVIGIKILAIVAASMALLVVIGLLIDDFIVWRKGGKSAVFGLLGDFETFEQRFKTIRENLKRDIEQFLYLIELAVKNSIDNMFFGLPSLLLDAFGTMENLLPDSVRNLFSQIRSFIDEQVPALKIFVKDITKDIFLSALETIPGLGTAFRMIRNLPGNITGFLGAAEREGGIIPESWTPGLDATGGFRIPMRRPESTSTSTNVNIDSNIQLYVPDTSREEQVRYVERAAQNAFDDRFKRELRRALTGAKGGEE